MAKVISRKTLSEVENLSYNRKMGRSVFDHWHNCRNAPWDEGSSQPAHQQAPVSLRPTATWRNRKNHKKKFAATLRLKLR